MSSSGRHQRACYRVTQACWCVQAIGCFLGAKALLEGSGDAGLEQLHAAQTALTELRSRLAAGLASGLRNDASDQAVAMRQRWRLADIRAEDYAFVLLSRFVGMLDNQARMGLGAQAELICTVTLTSWQHTGSELLRTHRPGSRAADGGMQGGAEALAGGGDGGWALPLSGAATVVRQVGQAGWQQVECKALQRELAAWQQAGSLSERLPALR